MGAYDYMVNVIQSGYISELNEKNKTQQEQIEELKTKVLNLEKWVVYLNSRLDMIESNNTKSRTGDEL